MRIWHKQDGHWTEVRGPADLQGATGYLRIEGRESGREVARWAVAIGVFVVQGGEIRRLDSE